MLASFQSDGTVLEDKQSLKMVHTGSANSYANSFITRLGIPSRPCDLKGLTLRNLWQTSIGVIVGTG
jgi:hypothetical protein